MVFAVIALLHQSSQEQNPVFTQKFFSLRVCVSPELMDSVRTSWFWKQWLNSRDTQMVLSYSAANTDAVLRNSIMKDKKWDFVLNLNKAEVVLYKVEQKKK